MGKLKCGFIIADARNTSSVRKGYEMSGYVKSFCSKHEKDTADNNEIKTDGQAIYLHGEIKAALLDAKAVAMKNTITARIPECGDFGGIAQNLDYVCEQLGIEDS